MAKARMAIGIAVYPLLYFFLLLGCADNQPVVGPYPKLGKASWYAPWRTSSGEKFEQRVFSCAIRKFDFGKYYKVCNIANNKCVVVRHNDFGPSRRMYLNGRIIDLSKSAFSQIADSKQGVIEVSVNEELAVSPNF